jgi:hypothetical protein
VKECGPVPERITDDDVELPEQQNLMAFFFVLTGYAAAVLSLITGALLGLAILASPGESQSPDGSRPKLVKGDPAQHMIMEPKRSAQAPGQAFRYGPDVNHGGSGTPVSATKQALTQARAAAPKKRQQLYQERIVRDPGVAMGFASYPSVVR